MSHAAVRQPRIAPDYARLREAPFSSDPYPHFVVPNFLSHDQVASVLRDFPVLDMGGLFLPEKAHGALREIIDALDGPAFRRILGGKLGIDLATATTLVTLRDRCTAKDGRIHADSSFKIATALLYLNEPWSSSDGCLRILRSGTNIEDYAREIPPDGGLLACFKVQENSWHGHKPFVGLRRYVMLNYCNGSVSRHREAAKHYLSGKVKHLRRFLAARR